MDLTKPAIIEIPSVKDTRGSLSVLESPETLPFDIARVYWLYDVPADAEREGHAMLTQSEAIIALAGSFDVVTTDSDGNRRTFHLDRNYRALYLPPLTWREIDNFTTCSIALTLSSALFNEDDYVRNFEEFKSITSAGAL